MLTLIISFLVKSEIDVRFENDKIKYSEYWFYCSQKNTSGSWLAPWRERLSLLKFLFQERRASDFADVQIFFN